MTICVREPHLQGLSVGSDAWPVLYETVGSSSSAVERWVPSMSELSLIHSLRDQLKSAQQGLKTVTAKVDVALSKASQAASAEKFLLDEIENLGKAMKCKTYELLICYCSSLQCAIIFFSSLVYVCLDNEAEARRVNAHLHAAQIHANSVADNFRADRSKAMKLTDTSQMYL
jgi:hypothetical protein